MHSAFASFKSLSPSELPSAEEIPSVLDCMEQPSRGIARKKDGVSMKKGFIVYVEPMQGLARKGILEKIQESGYRRLRVYELSWFTGADIFFILKVLKQLSRDLISSGLVLLYTGVIRSGRWHSG